jgi:hypothetical protein
MREIERLEGWVSLNEAAQRLDVSRQFLHKKIADDGWFESARSIGEGKPFYVVETREVELYKVRIDQERQQRADRATAKETGDEEVPVQVLTPDEIAARLG